MNDTSQAIEDKLREMIQKKSPIERLLMGVSMYETSKYLIIRSIKERNPHISDLDLRKQIFLKFYEDDFSEAAKESILKYIH